MKGWSLLAFQFGEVEPACTPPRVKQKFYPAEAEGSVAQELSVRFESIR